MTMWGGATGPLNDCNCPYKNEQIKKYIIKEKSVELLM